MRFVKLMLKIWPELMVLLSSISYTIIRLVADVNKLPLPTWFDDFNIPTISLFLMVFILLYRSKVEKNGYIWPKCYCIWRIWGWLHIWFRFGSSWALDNE